MPTATNVSQFSCENPGVLVNPAAMQMINGPMDMSFQSCEHKPRVAFHLPLEANNMDCVSAQYYGSQYTSANFQPMHDNTQACVDRDVVLLYAPYTDHHLISSMSPHDIKDVHTNNNDGNLAMSAVQINNCTTHNISSENVLSVSMHHRAKREFVPDNRKDDSYWCKRIKNNDSARRSRVKRKALETIMQARLLELQKENFKLKHEVAALRQRYAEDDMFQSDPSSSKCTISLNTASLPSSLPETTKTNSVQRSASSDDTVSPELSRVVGAAIIPSSDHSFGTEITDYIENNSYSKTNIRRSTISRTESGESQISSCDSGIQKTDALDLTGKCNLSAPAWRSFSSDDGENTSSSYRRYSYMTSDSSSQEDNTGVVKAKVFPLKCRWKREMQSTQIPVSE